MYWCSIWVHTCLNRNMITDRMNLIRDWDKYIGGWSLFGSWSLLNWYPDGIGMIPLQLIRVSLSSKYLPISLGPLRYLDTESTNSGREQRNSFHQVKSELVLFRLLRRRYNLTQTSKRFNWFTEYSATFTAINSCHVRVNLPASLNTPGTRAISVIYVG